MENRLEAKNIPSFALGYALLVVVVVSHMSACGLIRGLINPAITSIKIPIVKQL